VRGRKVADKLAEGLVVADKPVELTGETMGEFIERHLLVVVDFWHPKCEPCRKLHPVVDELAGEYAGKCAFGKINVDKGGSIDPDLRKKYNLIFGVPTMLIFEKGQLVEYLVESTAQIPSIIRQVIEHHLEQRSSERAEGC
jgi:thioredoxin 1